MDRFGKDQVIAMDAFASLIAVAALVVAPFALLALAAIRYGADSRSGISDRDQRPWLVPTT
jgi:hypothetical protein